MQWPRGQITRSMSSTFRPGTRVGSRSIDRFSQAEGEEMRGVRGLGIGLAIVRELAEAHGGAVEARSDGPGTGATFVVTLPGRLPQAPARSAVG